MDSTVTRRRRTREEILAWLDAARQRQAAWEKRMQAEFAEEKRLRNQNSDVQ
ncbi:MAG: 30S ribosomal protein S7 [Bacteroidaceae bacterium]|nr:30S ribosomal protein S7 [Bacteroidaceae bacterium]MBR6368045.1 30S ribosomal protein S7 [Bacteroidaceae bacterium]